jgi:hypothetical protein
MNNLSVLKKPTSKLTRIKRQHESAMMHAS